MSAPVPSLEVAVTRFLSHCRRTPTGCLANPKHNRYGEIRSIETGRTTAHRAVYILAHGEVSPLEVVRHKCDFPPCVEITHLERGSVAQNARDMYERDRRRGVRSGVPGEGNPSAVLTRELVVSMRQEARAGTPITEIAACHAVSYSAARSAIRGSNWAHVTEEPPVPQVRHWTHQSRTRISDEIAERAVALAAEGKSLAEIALELGVHRSTAYELTHRALEEPA